MSQAVVELSDLERTDIAALGAFVSAQIDAHWQGILQRDGAALERLFATEGDAAYGVFQKHLFKPIKESLKAAGLKAVPNLPGDFGSSREWGNESETHQQRWMWSVILSPSGQMLGTLVNVIHHDHTAFRVPHAPEVIALRETDSSAIAAALSSRSADFADALEFTVWYAQYLESRAW
jgi:hypothetical protein